MRIATYATIDIVVHTPICVFGYVPGRLSLTCMLRESTPYMVVTTQASLVDAVVAIVQGALLRGVQVYGKTSRNMS